MNQTTATNPGKKSDEKKTTTPAGGTSQSNVCAHTHDGKVVSITGSKLVMSNHEGKECTHTVAADAKVTCDDVVCRTEDLKAGSRIRLTTKPDDKQTAIRIESLKKHTDFAKTC